MPKNEDTQMGIALGLPTVAIECKPDCEIRCPSCGNSFRIATKGLVCLSCQIKLPFQTVNK